MREKGARAWLPAIRREARIRPMDPQHESILNRIREAFHEARGPARCRNPRHCAECAEADRMLLDLDPGDLNRDDLDNSSRDWIFPFSTDEGLRWLIPGMVRVALEQSPPEPWLFFDRIASCADETFNEEQWAAIVEFRDVCVAGGWLSRERGAEIGPGKFRKEPPG